MPGAFSYVVELKDSAGRSLPNARAEGTSITITVPPGVYLVRVLSLDAFRRPAGASPWKKVRIVRKGQPEVDALDPGHVVPGSALPLVVTGHNIDDETAAILRKSAGGPPILPVSVRELGPGKVEFDFPRLSDVGLYGLELDNKPDYSLVLPDCIAVRHDPAVVLSIEPRILDLLSSAPLVFSLRADKIERGATVELEREGESRSLTPSRLEDGSLSFELPARTERGRLRPRHRERPPFDLPDSRGPAARPAPSGRRLPRALFYPGRRRGPRASARGAGFRERDEGRPLDRRDRDRARGQAA